MVDEETMAIALREAGWTELIPGVWQTPQKSFEDSSQLLTTGEAYGELRRPLVCKHRIRRKTS